MVADAPREARHQRSQQLAAIALALALIAAATLNPQAGDASPHRWHLASWNPGDGADVILNVVLFAPLGIALARAGVRRDRAVALAFLTTVGVELLQMAIPGRQASVADLVCNTLGGWLGHRLAGAMATTVAAPPQIARRLAVGYAATWMLATLLGAALLRPVSPRLGQRSACGPGPRLPDCFPGRLLAAPRLRSGGGPELTLDRHGELVPVGEGTTVSVVIQDGGETTVPGHIAGVVDARWSVLMTLEQQRGRLAFYGRARGEDYGLRTPAVVLPGLLGRAGRQVTISAGISGTSRWLVADGRRAELTPSSAEGWRLLFPWTAATGRSVAVVGALFQAVTLLPLGYLAARATTTGAGRRLVPRVAAAACAPVAAYLAGSALFGVSLPHLSDWIGALAGVAGGAAAAGMTSPFVRR